MKQVRSKPEAALRSMVDWEYEPFTIEYQATYLPDFVTKGGTLVEVKQFLDAREWRRVRDVHKTCHRQGVLFIVLVYIEGSEYERKAKGWPRRGENLVAYLQSQGIRAASYSSDRYESALSYVAEQEDCFQKFKAGTSGID